MEEVQEIMTITLSDSDDSILMMDEGRSRSSVNRSSSAVRLNSSNEVDMNESGGMEDFDSDTDLFERSDDETDIENDNMQAPPGVEGAAQFVVQGQHFSQTFNLSIRAESSSRQQAHSSQQFNNSVTESDHSIEQIHNVSARPSTSQTDVVTDVSDVVIIEVPDVVTEVPDVSGITSHNHNALHSQISSGSQSSLTCIPSNLQTLSGTQLSTMLMVNQQRVEVREVSMDIESATATNSSTSNVNVSLLDFSVKKVTKQDDSSDDEGQVCSICYEQWTNSGKHRVASLNCGHLFGKSCIEKWLKGNHGKCPQCNAKAKKSDIRVLYVKALKVVDTAECDRALKDLENERVLRRTAEIKSEQLHLKYQMALEEVKMMKMQMRAEENGSQSNPRNTDEMEKPSQSSTTEIVGKYILQKTIQVSANGKCRVMAYDSTYDALLVSLPSPRQLFPGFGVKKISAIDASNSYISIHKSMIRDLCCNERQDGLLLSASVDKTMKITSLRSLSTVQTFKAEQQFWSCAWNTDDVNYVYGGLQNGSVMVYDTRQPSMEVQILTNSRYSTPMISLIYIPCGGPSFTCGLLINTLETTGFWEKKNGAEWFCHDLDIHRRCTGMSFDHGTRHLLASFRRSDTIQYTRRVMYHFQCHAMSATDTKMVACTPIETFYGGSTMQQLTRSRIFPSPTGGRKLLICGGDEASGSAHVWDASSGKVLQKIQVNANVLDVCPFEFNNKNFLATLTEKDVNIFNWQNV